MSKHAGGNQECNERKNLFLACMIVAIVFSIPVILVACNYLGGQNSEMQPLRDPAEQSNGQLELALKNTTERLLTILERGEPREVISLISSKGVVFGLEPPPVASTEIRKQFAAKTGVYCLLFDTECLRKEDRAEREKAGAPTRVTPLSSYRERVQKASHRKVRSQLIQQEGRWAGHVTVLLESPANDDNISPENSIEFEFVFEEGEWHLAGVVYG